MTVATYVLEVNWIGDGTTWVDETAYLQSVQWTRGRDYASQLTGRAKAGTLKAKLLNVSGRFSPFYSAGALYGNLLPGRKVRWRTTAPSATTLWMGYLNEIRPDPGSRDAAPSVVLDASGPLRFIGDRKAQIAISTNVATGTAVGLVLDDAGWAAGDRTIDTGQVTMTRWKADGLQALTALRDLEETEFGFISESADGKIVFEDVFHRLLSPHTTSQATFSDASGAALSYDSIEELDPWREIFNRFEADVTTWTVQSLATLWNITGEVPSIQPSSTRDFWALYPTPDAATQADHVDAWTTPVSGTDYIANTASDGSGSNVTASMTVVVSKFANSMKISVTNTTAAVAYLTTLQARGTAVYKNDPIRVGVEDATSQTKYGKRNFPLPGKFYPTTVRAQSFVEYGLSRYKDLLPVLALTFQANMDAAHMTQALTRDVSERVTVRADATTASGAQLGINEDFYIEAMTHRYDLKAHTVTYQLSSAKGDGGYWILGTSQLGTTTKLAP